MVAVDDSDETEEESSDSPTDGRLSWTCNLPGFSTAAFSSSGGGGGGGGGISEARDSSAFMNNFCSLLMAVGVDTLTSFGAKFPQKRQVQGKRINVIEAR